MILRDRHLKAAEFNTRKKLHHQQEDSDVVTVTGELSFDVSAWRITTGGALGGDLRAFIFGRSRRVIPLHVPFQFPPGGSCTLGMFFGNLLVRHVRRS